MQQLSDRTEELGHRVQRTTIADIELGRRKYIAVHELSLIAAVLGVTPAQLLTYGDLPEGTVEVLPGANVNAQDVAEWWGGRAFDYCSRLGRELPSHPRSVLTEASRDLQGITRAITSALAYNLPTSKVIRALESRREELVATVREHGGFLSSESRKS